MFGAIQGVLKLHDRLSVMIHCLLLQMSIIANVYYLPCLINLIMMARRYIVVKTFISISNGWGRSGGTWLRKNLIGGTLLKKD